MTSSISTPPILKHRNIPVLRLLFFTELSPVRNVRRQAHNHKRTTFALVFLFDLLLCVANKGLPTYVYF